MGWVAINGVNTPSEWIKTTLNETKIITKKIYHNEAYIAYKLDDKTITCLVVIFKRNKYKLLGKIIGENMGPHNYKCPKEILDLLTPTTNPYALKFRKRCEEYNKLKIHNEKNIGGE
ncbi:MAG: hypothetical protein QXR03_03730 [Candidatus Aenigmatarchaeota archaeon]